MERASDGRRREESEHGAIGPSAAQARDLTRYRLATSSDSVHPYTESLPETATNRLYRYAESVAVREGQYAEQGGFG